MFVRLAQRLSSGAIHFLTPSEPTGEPAEGAELKQVSDDLRDEMVQMCLEADAKAKECWTIGHAPLHPAPGGRAAGNFSDSAEDDAEWVPGTADVEQLDVVLGQPLFSARIAFSHDAKVAALLSADGDPDKAAAMLLGKYDWDGAAFDGSVAAAAAAAGSAEISEAGAPAGRHDGSIDNDGSEEWSSDNDGSEEWSEEWETDEDVEWSPGAAGGADGVAGAAGGGAAPPTLESVYAEARNDGAPEKILDLLSEMATHRVAVPHEPADRPSANFNHHFDGPLYASLQELQEMEAMRTEVAKIVAKLLSAGEPTDLEQGSVVASRIQLRHYQLAADAAKSSEIYPPHGEQACACHELCLGWNLHQAAACEFFGAIIRV